jgi:uncharacterized membrane protein
VLGDSRPRAAAADGADVAVGNNAAIENSAAGLAQDAPRPSAWRDRVPWGIASLVFAAYFTISLYRLLRLNPGSYDLGIYTEFVQQLSLLHAPIVDILGSGFNLFGNHFQIGVAVLAPFFRVFPSPATLLFFQALAIAVSVFPVTTAGTALAGRTAGRLIGFGYGFSWGLQQLAEFDFHEIALVIPLVAFSLSALVRRRPAAAICWAMPMVFIEEDQGFTLAAIGSFLVLSVLGPRLLAALPLPRRLRAALPSALSSARSDAPSGGPADAGHATRRGGWLAGDRGDPQGYRYTALWGGVFLIGWGVFWSAFAIAVFIPHFNPAHQYYFWKDGGVVGGAGGSAFSPVHLAAQLGEGWSVKLQTIVLLLLPTAFAALGSPVALIALPGLALRFVSTNTAYWGTGWQYNATIMPILFIAAAVAVGRWQRMRDNPAAPAWSAARRGIGRHGPAMMAAVAIALAFQFPLNNLWHASTYRLDAHVAAADAAMAVVPDGATVLTTLDMLAPLAARTDTFWIGNAGNPLTQYVVFDGDDSGYSPPVTNVPAFIAQMYPHNAYVQVFERDGVYVYRRAVSPRGGA